ncbi:MAG: hypothetical protein HW416_1225 [Chloroflexi bacterium]|nr:hypothetical protein [Chloroflexota bacterium]
MEHALSNALLSVGFATLGFVLLFVGFLVFDLLTPGNLKKKILEEGNVAAAILAGAFVLALALVVHAAIS